MAAAHLEPIPTPPGKPFVGNLFDMDRDNPMESLMKLAREYGPIFRMDALGGSTRNIVSGVNLVDELCDESRFDKMLGPGLVALQSSAVGHGLFTSWTSDPKWHQAHNILLPAFSQEAMRGYHQMMLDIAAQLMLKWQRLNSDDTVDVPADMTRLTLDTIALCGFDYRFNSFYRDTPHPFVVAMLGTLEAAQQSQRELPIQRALQRGAAQKAREDEAFMVATVRRILDERRASGAMGSIGDLLDRMLTVADRQSGQKLDDNDIVAQCITFLVAGHETTSGLLSFATYGLIKHPDVLAKAYEEVDRVLGTDLSVLPTYAQIHQLPYVRQILDETLRLWPTAPAFSRYPYQDTVIGGKYQLEKDSTNTILIGMLHRDKQVWGDDAEDFNPDHFSEARRDAIPPNAYKPFGTGQRACIGRQFALTEATLVLGMVLQRFELEDFANYQLETRQTLTVKPHDFHLKVRLRAGRTGTTGAVAARPASDTAPVAAPAAAPLPVADAHHTPLLVLYGSNLGTAEGIAHGIAQDATSRGFATTVGALDDHVGALPTEGGLVIVTASYNGQPPDNAAKFCQWLQDPALPADAFQGVEYTVFGCGNRDWSATYQRIPTLIDAELEKHGAKRLYPRGEGDARADFDGEYRAWYGPLWQSVATALALPDSVGATQQAAGPRFAVTWVNKQAANPIVTSYSATSMTVKANRELQTKDGDRPSDRSTRHVELALPAGCSYGTGDHLGIVPRNQLDLLRRVLLRFKLDAGLYLTITPTTSLSTHLPVNEPVPLVDLLSSRVELQDVATRPQIQTLALHCQDPTQRDALLALAGDDDASQARYRDQVLVPHQSLLDLLDVYPSCALPFDAFLDMLPPLRPRYYSISSSPLVAADTCSITVGVVEGPARKGSGTFRGVASSFLAQRPLDSLAFGFIHKPTLPFHPPDNPHLPMIMVGCGTGLAPFRGFLQERQALKQQGVPIGDALLFFGCRDPDQDFLYADELRAFEAAGVVKLYTAFSRVPDQPKTYVQQVISAQAADVWALLQHEAVIYVCGDASRMAPDVRKAIAGVFQAQTGTSEADAQAWLTGLVANNRYLEDIWASAT